MKYFFDLEFNERGRDFPLVLISIGIVAEDGRELYLVSKDFKPEDCNDWVKANVLPQLPDRKNMGSYLHVPEIAEWVKLFVGEEPEFWGYYCDYDWVILCQLFGTMMDLPPGWPMYANDLKQLVSMYGNPRLMEQEETEHSAINDARWIKKSYGRL